MLRVLVGHSYFLRFDSKQLERAKPYPPLATLQAAALVRRAGHQVSLFDAMLAEGLQEYQAQLKDSSPQIVVLYEDNFNFLSKMCLGKMRHAACEMTAAARRAGARVIAAGSDASDAPELYLRAGADLVLLGEGLNTLQALLARLDTHPELTGAGLIDGLSGVAALVAGKVVTGQGPKPMAAPQQADELPAWDLVDMTRYRSVWMKAHGRFSLNMAGSKGCSFRCAWCAKPIWGSRYLQRDAAAVGAEMVYLKRQFQPDHVWFADDIFGMRADWVRTFAEAVRAQTQPIPFTVQIRADLISPGMAQALGDAGCAEAWIGAESGSQKILDAMDKGTTVEEILAARLRLKSHGVRVGFFIQLGYLGEQLDDILATRSLIDTAQPDDIGVSVSYPLPGTKFYDKVKDQLGDKTRWDESNDLAMMFQGTYNSDFYREIRDLLHRQVEVQKLNSPGTMDEYRQARLLLQQRWDSLVAPEAQHWATPLAAVTTL